MFIEHHDEDEEDGEEGSDEEYSDDEQGSNDDDENENVTVGLSPQQQELLQIVSCRDCWTRSKKKSFMDS